MNSEDIKQLIVSEIPGAKVVLDGDGCHFSAHVASAEFEGLSPVKKQQRVLAAVSHLIQDGTLHAFTVKTYTPKEWEASQWSD